MKRYLLIVLLVSSFTLRAQEKQVDSFLGIKFGSSKSEVLKAMTARGSVLNSKESKADVQNYDNVKIGNRRVDLFSVRFVDNKVFQADFYFIPKLEANTIDFYNEIVQDITLVYGAGDSFKNFQKPYEEGDGYELTAIKLGKAKYKTYWTRKNTIVTEIIPDAMAIRLEYQDSDLVQIAINKQNEVKKSDF